MQHATACNSNAELPHMLMWKQAGRQAASQPGGLPLVGRVYLGLHEPGVALVGLGLQLELPLLAVGLQQAAALQHLHLVLQLSQVPLQGGDLGVLHRHQATNQSAGRQADSHTHTH